ncbi:long-chain fatty acid--CoA ligase [Maricurvus nonylphenolicus]|uniref:AMP-binding protein n=1 Tax=Maricurvus nonylphenolicus TaxID=1008307 RepID=UPI0036F205C6
MNVAIHVQRASKVAPNTIATIYGDRTRTWSQFHSRVGRFAAGLKDVGVKAGSRVAILSLNSDKYLECFYAIPWVGGVVVPMNTRWSVEENLYALKDCGADVLLVSDEFLSYVDAFKQEATDLKHIVYLGDGDLPQGMMSYEGMIDSSEPMLPERRLESDPIGIFYTGGTTGFPKGVLLPVRAFNFQAQLGLSQGGIDEQTRALHVAPMFHVADLVLTLPVTAVAATHIIVPWFDPESMLQQIEQHRVTHTMVVPTMLKMMVDTPSIDNRNLDSLYRILYGASSITESLINDAMRKMPGITFTQAYGQSEASAVTVLSPEDHRPEREKLRSAGKPAPGVDITIVDENRQPVAFGITGEIVINAPNRMLCYWNKPEQTGEVLVDGLIYSGDAGYMDSEGYVYIQDRIKDMIITGGENVFCAEVENAMVAHEAVKECAVIGVADEKWGENVHAIVILHEGETVTQEALIEHCRSLIAGYKCPRSIDFRTEPLPLSAAGKVLKTELRKLYQVKQA